VFEEVAGEVDMGVEYCSYCGTPLETAIDFDSYKICLKCKTLHVVTQDDEEFPCVMLFSPNHPTDEEYPHPRLSLIKGGKQDET
jgi:hypothetical protein